jgi:hypothetical protein
VYNAVQSLSLPKKKLIVTVRWDSTRHSAALPAGGKKRKDAGDAHGSRHNQKKRDYNRKYT